MEGWRVPPPILLAALMASVTLVSASCGSSGSASREAGLPGVGETERDISAWRAERDRRRAELERYWRPPSQEPTATIPAGPPPKRLVVEDIRVGSGPPLRVGEEGIVNTVSYVFETRRQSDTSYDRNLLPVRVVPGTNELVRGFERGVVGMRVGGRRQVIVPSRLAYGSRGFPPLVEPGQSLVYVIDLEHIDR